MSRTIFASLLAIGLSISVVAQPPHAFANEAASQGETLTSGVQGVADSTIDRVQSQSDTQLARLMAEYASISLLVLDMKAAHSYSSLVQNIDDPTVRMAVNAGTYTVVLGATSYQAWKTLGRIRTIPKLIQATPGLATKVKVFGGAALRASVLGGVAYAVWRTNIVLMLDKNDYNEIMMELEGNIARLEQQLTVQAKAKLNPNSAAKEQVGSPELNEKLFKIE